ncbi:MULTISPECIES: ScbA/BarX family gamma-butyrolactone biosynthesis protein [Streptomyces rochei group]|uniref:ScbA/BarX family gamma-butyrolactone biosynthesis protein n=1 Tax=Streptomyces rochei group TaxID=2867164 RepID=UPI001873B116|nr:ScbA/BarX family gamma-butyrolactone biosynthesis protein [Streptomyces vinaceusdrappus]GHC37719.1 adhesin [Streptomyces vinaceusdrappus]
MATSAFPATHPALGQEPVLPAGTPRLRPSLFRYPNLTTTVPKELVHRAAVAEVMLTDWERVDDTRFKVAAQWPRGHSFFTPIDGRYHDPLIAAETIRQVGSLLGHAEFGVPFGHHYLLHDLSLRVDPHHLMIHQAPASLDLDVTCQDLKMRGGRLAALRYQAVVRRDGHTAATGVFSFSCVSPTVYRRLRPPHVFADSHRPLPLTAPAAPQSVGRMSPADVVLSPTEDPHRWQLRLDTQHPVLFDHPGDHVPGMVLLEAARQAAAGALGRTSLLPLALTSELVQYAELDIPCIIEAAPHPTHSPGLTTVHITGHQRGQTVFTCTVTAADA